MLNVCMSFFIRHLHCVFVVNWMLSRILSLSFSKVKAFHMEPHDMDDADFLRAHGWTIAMRPQWGDPIWAYRDGSRLLWAKTQAAALKLVKSKKERLAKAASQGVST